jgi:hypothetical protein
MEFEDIYAKYDRHFSPKVKEVLYNRVSPDAKSIIVNKKTIKVESLVLLARPKNKFFIIDTVRAMADDIGRLIESNILVGSPEGPQVLIKKDLDRYIIKMNLTINSDYASEARSWCALNFSIHDTDTPKVYPQEYVEPKCTCGVHTIYGKNALRQMHSDFCEFSEINPEVYKWRY